MRRLFSLLPGPLPVKIVTAIVVVGAALVGLFFFYEWLGSTYLDTGGTVG